MAHVFVHLKNSAGAPLTGASPTLDYWDTNTPGTPAATGVAMTELVGGLGGGYFAVVATTDGREYLGVIDGGASASPRYQAVVFSGQTDARIETDIPAILVDTDVTIPSLITTSEANIRGGDSRDLTEIAGAGFTVGVDDLVQAHNKLDAITSDLGDFQNQTRVAISTPILERPESGTTQYEIWFNLKDDQGDPVNADAGITVEITSHGGTAGDRDGNADSTTLTNVATGRYRLRYSVADTHLLEGLHFAYSWAEGGNADVRDVSATVIDSNLVGYTAADRTRDNQIAVETAAIDGRLPSDPADESVQLAAHAATQALIAALNDLSIADVQTAMTAQGYTAARAILLDNLDAAISTVTAAIAALNDLSIADVQTAMDNQGYTAVRAALVDNLDAAISMVLSTGGPGPWTTAAAGTGLTPTQAAQLFYVWTWAGADPANKMNFRRAVIGTPGAVFSDDLLVNQEVVQVDNLNATFEQQ